MSKVIMIQGTMSGVGKSLICAGLCRIFTQDGYNTAPFKSQNMALNSYVTLDGLEIGRAQAVQAFACKKEPSVDMNPILLKPTTDMGSQVIVNGKVRDQLMAADYYREKHKFLPEILKAYERLQNENDIIVIEGAGSPAEINLNKDDFVNMGLANLVDAPVLLIGDIDRGGVFAQLYGTVRLLSEAEQSRIKGLIVNKFRGDIELFKDGIELIEEICQKDVLGVVPYSRLDIEEEDSLSERLEIVNERRVILKPEATINIAIIKLPRMSNYTDFQALEIESDTNVKYVSRSDELKNADLIIIPGTKNSIADLHWLKESGLASSILRMSEKVPVLGICGGYQMLGASIIDEDGVDGDKGVINAMGLLSINTYFEKEKVLGQNTYTIEGLTGIFEVLNGTTLSGYEIHNGQSGKVYESCKNVFGTYVHGLFDDVDFRNKILEAALKIKGVERQTTSYIDYDEYRDDQLDKLADILRESLDIEKIYTILGMKG